MVRFFVLEIFLSLIHIYPAMVCMTLMLLNIDKKLDAIQESQKNIVSVSYTHLNLHHKNSKYFEDVSINPSLKATMDINVVKEADVVLLAVPTIAIESICQQIDLLLTKKTIIVNVSKGFHPTTNERMSQVIRRCISADHLSSVVSLIDVYKRQSYNFRFGYTGG